MTNATNYLDPDEIAELDALGELPSSDAEKHPGFFVVAIYLIDLERGGPEEGGWYYTRGALCDALIEEMGDEGLPRVFIDETAANNWMTVVQAKLDATINVGRREISSVLSEGRYEALVSDGWPVTFFPAQRPHYE